MKLRLTLLSDARSPEVCESTDIIIDSEPTTSVGEIARSITDFCANTLQKDWYFGIIAPTLCVHAEQNQQSLIIRPSAHLSMSGITDGMQISVTPHLFEYSQNYTSEIVGTLTDSQTQAIYPLYAKTTFGRDMSCDIQVLDSLVSRLHCNITVQGSEITATDLGSRNGTKYSDQMIIIAQNKYIIQLFEMPISQKTVPSTQKWVNRNYLIPPPLSAKGFTTPKKPDDPPKTPLNIISLCIPLVMGVILYMVMPNPMTVAFMMMSPFMILGNWLFQKRRQSKEKRTKQKEYADKCTKFKQKLEQRLQRESSILYNRFPLAQQIKLWQKHISDADFSLVRAGVGDMPALATKNKKALKLQCVPYLVDFKNGVAILASNNAIENYINALLLQCALMYSPADLKFGILSTSAISSDYEWLKWTNNLDTELISCTTVSELKVLEKLYAILKVRSSQGKSSESGFGTAHKKADSGLPCHYLILVYDVQPENYALLEQLIIAGRKCGIWFLWLNNNVSYHISTLVNIAEKVTLRLRKEPLREHLLESPQLISANECEHIAKEIMNYRDLSQVMADDEHIPNYLPFNEMLDYDAVNNTAMILHNWETVDYTLSPLRAALGASGSGMCTVDLRQNGPHALVGGTTGAGKSEFLQTWITSLALQTSPERLNFLLVDYKGGSAFAKCAQFPHTVGMITDLDTHLTGRVIRSLHAELIRREKILHSASAKDIIAYEIATEQHSRRYSSSRRCEGSQNLWQSSDEAVMDCHVTNAPRNDDRETLANLVIVIDEFAALAKEMPEFVDEIVDIAARGRSLGIHLIMATQRPGGVIKDNIKANTNLRIALRVADVSESNDVIGTDSAANISRKSPGRFYFRSDNNVPVEAQSAYIGYNPQTMQNAPQISDFRLTATNSEEKNTSSSINVAEDSETYLDQIATTLSNSFTSLQDKHKVNIWRPWQDGLPAKIPFSNTNIALLDLVDEQKQVPLNITQLQTNTLITGTAGSGKTSCLLTLLAGNIVNSPQNICYTNYIIDCANGKFPFVDGTFAQIIKVDEKEKLYRLLQTILTNDSAVSETQQSVVNLYIDRIDLLKDALEEPDMHPIANLFNKLIAGANANTVRIYATQGRVGGIYQNWTSYFEAKMWLKLSSENEYNIAGIKPNYVPVKMPAGRALAQISQVDNGNLTELQFTDVAYDFWSSKHRNVIANTAWQIKTVDDVMTQNTENPTLSNDMFALNVADFSAFELPFERRTAPKQTFVIGKKGSGYEHIAGQIAQRTSQNVYTINANTAELDIATYLESDGVFIIAQSVLADNWNLLNHIRRAQCIILVGVDKAEAGTLINIDYPNVPYVGKAPMRGYFIYDGEVKLVQFMSR